MDSASRLKTAMIGHINKWNASEEEIAELVQTSVRQGCQDARRFGSN